MVWPYIIFFLIAGIVSFFASLLARYAASRFNVLDDPAVSPLRKLHLTPTPLLGGWAIFAGLVVATVASLIWFPRLVDSFLQTRQLMGIALGACALMVVGTIDDFRSLKPASQLIAPICAALLVIAGGVGVAFITNPFGGVIVLNRIQWTILTVSNVPYHLTLFSDLFTFAWLLLMMYATKLLDGLDGLATGIGTIGAIVMCALSLTTHVNQPGTALLAAIVAGACAGFLPLNRFRARLFLGEGGSLLIGFMLGVISVIAGAKIATALLIMAFPLLDVAWVIITRIRHKRSIFSADRSHLHFRLVDAGISQQRAVWILYCVASLFGASALVFQSVVKLILLCVAICISLLLVWYTISHKRQAV